MRDTSIQASDASQTFAPRSKLSYNHILKPRNPVCGNEGEQRIGRSSAGYPMQVVVSDSLRWCAERHKSHNMSSASKWMTGQVMQDVAWPEASPVVWLAVILAEEALCASSRKHSPGFPFARADDACTRCSSMHGLRLRMDCLQHPGGHHAHAAGADPSLANCHKTLVHHRSTHFVIRSSTDVAWQ